MWESRVLRRAFERLELHEGKLSRAVLRGGGGGDVTSLPDAWVGNHPGLPGPDFPCRNQDEARKDAADREAIVAALREQLRQGDKSLIGNKGYRRYVSQAGPGGFGIDEAKIAED